MTAPDWLAAAIVSKAKADALWATIPDALDLDRPALIATLTEAGRTSGCFSGHIEGAEFFARQTTNDLRSLLRDHWFLEAWTP